MSDITRYRGDTRRIRKTVRDGAGAVVDITDWAFVLTINSEADPEDAAEQVAQLVGTIYDAPNGVVDFLPAVADVEVAGTFYYDIQATDADGGFTTLDKGQFTLLQDITKDAATNAWTAADGVLGQLVPLDGSAFWQGIGSPSLTYLTYRDRDGTPVAALEGSDLQKTYLWPTPPVSTRTAFGRGAFEFEFLAYVGNDCYIRWETDSTYSPNNYVYVALNTALGEVELAIQVFGWEDSWTAFDSGPALTLPGWVQFKIRLGYVIEDNGANGNCYSMKVKAWQPPATEPTAWDMEDYSTPGEDAHPLERGMRLYMDMTAPGGVLELAWFRWERVA